MCLLYCNPIVHSKHVFVKLINVSCRNFEFLIPDAPELIANFLEGEQDASCKRNAFMMLIHADQVGMLLLAGKHQLCTLDIWILDSLWLLCDISELEYNLPKLMNDTPKRVKDMINTHSLQGFINYGKNDMIHKYSNICIIQHCYICQQSQLHL